MRYSGFQFPDGVALLDRETGSLVYYPIDGGEPRVIRGPDSSGRRPVTPLDSETSYVGDARAPEVVRPEGGAPDGNDSDEPFRSADTDPGLRRSVRLTRPRGAMRSATGEPMSPPPSANDAEGAEETDENEASEADENEASTLGSSEGIGALARIVLTQWPYPVATRYRAYLNEADPRRACRRLVAVTRTLVRLLAMVAARDAMGALAKRELEPDPALSRLLQRDLQRPSLATWYELLRRSLATLEATGATPFCPPLSKAFDHLDRRCEDPFVLERAEPDGDGASDDGRPTAPLRLGLLQALVNYRQSLTHGFTFDRETAEEHLATYRPVLDRVLAACSFLSDYTLVTVSGNEHSDADQSGDERSSTEGLELRGVGPTTLAVDLGEAAVAGASSVWCRHATSGRLLELAGFAVVAERSEITSGGTSLAGDPALYVRRGGARAFYRTASERLVERVVANDALAEWPARSDVTPSPPRAPRSVDRTLLGDLARRVTSQALEALVSSRVVLPEATLRREALEATFQRFAFSSFTALALLGPAGSGKTTLLWQWARERQQAGDLVLFYRGATLDQPNLLTRLASDLGVEADDWPQLMMGLDPLFQVPEGEPSRDTVGPSLFLFLDGLDDAPADRPALARSIETMLELAAHRPWLRFVVSLGEAAWARLPADARPGRAGDRRYFRVMVKRDGVSYEQTNVVVPPLDEGRLGTFYESYRLFRGGEGSDGPDRGRFRPTTAFGEIAARSGVDAAVVGVLRQPLRLRLALRAFHGTRVPPDLRCDQVEAAWLERLALGDNGRPGDPAARATVLEVLIKELDARSAGVMARHDLEDIDRIGPQVLNPEADSAYSQLVDLGVLVEVWVGTTCYVGLTFEPLLAHLLADHYAPLVRRADDYLKLAERSVGFSALSGVIQRLLLRTASEDGAPTWQTLTARVTEARSSDSEDSERAAEALSESLVAALMTLATSDDPRFETALAAVAAASAGAVPLLRATTASLTDRGLRRPAKRVARKVFELAMADNAEVDAAMRAASCSDWVAALTESGELDPALDELERCLGECEAADEEHWAGLLALQQANLLWLRGDRARALAAASVARERLSSAKAGGPATEATLLEARLLAEEGHLDDALDRLRDGLVLAESEGRVLLAAESVLELRAPLQTSSQRAALAALFEPALMTIRHVGLHEKLPAILGRLGEALAGSDPGGAEARLRRGLALADRLGRSEDSAALQGQLGALLRDGGRVREAERALTHALELESSTLATARWRALLVGVQVDRGELAGQEAALRRAIREAQRDDRPENEGVATLVFASLHLAKGRLAQAEDYYRRARDRFVALGRSDLRGQALAGLAFTAWRRGDHETAAGRWAEVSELGKELVDVRLLASSLQGRATVSAERGGEGDAIKLLRSLSALAERHEQPLWRVWVAATGARVAHRAGALDQAAAGWNSAVERSEHLGLAPEAARARLGLAWVHLDVGRVGPAHEEARKATDFFESHEHDLDLADALALEGLCAFVAGRTQAAEEAFDRQRSLSAALGYDPGLARGLRLGAEVAFSTGASEEAATRWQRFVEMTEGDDWYRLDRDVLALWAALAEGEPDGVSRAQTAVTETTGELKVHRPVGEGPRLALEATADFWEAQGDSERAAAARMEATGDSAVAADAPE